MGMTPEDKGCAFVDNVSMTWEPLPHGLREQGGGVGTELSQVSVPPGKSRSRPHPEGQLQGSCLRTEGAPGVKGG